MSKRKSQCKVTVRPHNDETGKPSGITYYCQNRLGHEGRCKIMFNPNIFKIHEILKEEDNDE